VRFRSLLNESSSIGNLEIFQKSAIHLPRAGLRRDSSVGPCFYYAGKSVDNILTVAGNPEKARLATFPETMSAASEAGQL
jgi:hypothetical protein